MKKIFKIVFMLCCVVILCACSGEKNIVVENNIQNNEIIEENVIDVNDMTLNMLDTFEIKKGKVTFVNFWATWCGPCVGEMPDLQVLYDEMKNNDEIDMIFVNLGENKNDVKKFLKDMRYTMPMYCDEEGVLGEKYEIYAIPQTFIFDKNGEMVDKIVGANSKDVYYDAIKKALER